MNRDGNVYTFIFSAIMVFVVASVLAFTATSLKDLQAENVRLEKMQNILSTIGIQTDREKAEVLYDKYVTEELALKNNGSIDKSVNAFTIKLNTELKKDVNDQRFPLYVANVEENTYYIVPLRGAGLWDAIWGYLALEEDKNTIKGAVFDHKAETPGLGANIKQRFFMDDFIGESLLDSQGSFKGVTVSKTNLDPKNEDKYDNEVDAIAGSTITGDGVTAMIRSDLSLYQPYFNSLNN